MPKKILLVNESSVLATGFGVIGRELMTRWYEGGKYSLAELGTYVKESDYRNLAIPWKVYGGQPEDHDEEGRRKYALSIYSQFGEWCFNEVCLDFKPDIVVQWTDRWMSTEWILQSPFIDYVHNVQMPTIDGEPQRIPWLDDYSKVDTLLTYTDYGKKTLNREAPYIHVTDVIKPGVNHQQMRPLGQKEELRRKFGVPAGSNIILTVMRNQRRKLFPDLLDAFGQFLEMLKSRGDTEAAEKTYLYLHTSYPDVGWDIGKLLLERHLGHKVLFTYLCQKCGNVFSSFFQTEICTCNRCGRKACQMPNTDRGVTRDQLCEVYNMADVYTQLSIAEGLSCTVVEARSCSIPSLCVDYSATADQAHEPGCLPIPVEKFFYETVMETEQMRALPNNKALCDLLYDLLVVHPEKLEQMGKEGREHVSKYYSFDQAAKKFENIFDNIVVKDQNQTWFNPQPRFCPIDLNFSQNTASHTEFIDMAIWRILGKDPKSVSHLRSSLTKALNVGYIPQRTGPGSVKYQPINRDYVIKLLCDKAERHNYYERMRLQKLLGRKDNEIQYAYV